MALAHCLTGEYPSPKGGFAFFQTNAFAHHAALVAPDAEVSLTRGTLVKVYHLGPPLQVRGEATLPVDDEAWIGWFPELDDEDYQLVCAEVVRWEQWLAPDAEAGTQYDLGPHGLARADGNDQQEPGAKIHGSCASFLEQCYEAIGLDLVAEAHIPEVDSLSHLASVLGRNERMVRRWLSRQCELPVFPCRVLFPAYQMRAFQAGKAALPYEPTLSDHPFRL